MKTYFKEIIDLGHEYYNDMPNLGANHCAFWPLETFEHTRKITGGKLATEGKMILMAEHCGTHIDAPRHFDEHARPSTRFRSIRRSCPVICWTSPTATTARRSPSPTSRRRRQNRVR